MQKRKTRSQMKDISGGKRYRYYILYKPYGVLCQFTDSAGRKTLADIGQFPRDVYPVGRLDFDSEGLVLLTNDGMLKNILLDPENKHPRRYLAQIEKMPDEEKLNRLREGIELKGYRTLPADVQLLTNEPDIPSRGMPIRHRKNIPTAWLKLTLHEGKNRQVRRMTAAVGHPTFRLIRISIGSLTLGNMQPGEVREMTSGEIHNLKKLLEHKLHG